MLSNYLRLKGKSNFFEVRNKGSLSQGQYVGISKLKINSESNTKIGVVVSTKISKKAVVRNRIRRAIYDGVGLYYSNLPRGYNLVIMSKRNAVEANYQDISEDVVKTLSTFFR
jgi:ribonuclease P protein component